MTKRGWKGDKWSQFFIFPSFLSLFPLYSYSCYYCSRFVPSHPLLSSLSHECELCVTSILSLFIILFYSQSSIPTSHFLLFTLIPSAYSTSSLPLFLFTFASGDKKMVRKRMKPTNIQFCALVHCSIPLFPNNTDSLNRVPINPQQSIL